jgi:hypothetical protein
MLNETNRDEVQACLIGRISAVLKTAKTKP